MKLEDLALIEKRLQQEELRRVSLGGYSTDAEAILLLTEILHKVVQHLVEEYTDDRSPKRRAK